MSRRRLAGAGLLIAAMVVVHPGRALADPAGPTEFRSSILAVEPATPSISLSIEGGDSFVRIVVDPGTEVVVLGYDGEPATRIAPDGTVFENIRSFATYYNDDRFGTDDIPAIVDNEAPPEWRRVGAGGAWAWHDHRAHWMAPDPPVGMQPGDSLPVQTIPLVVDGREVGVDVMSTLVADPSPWPSLLGVAGGVALCGWAVAAGRRRAPLAAAVLSTAALSIGAAQFLSLPAETGPAPIWWLAPAVALVSASLSWWWRAKPLFRDGLVAIAGAQLLLWTFERRLTLVRPVLPTDAPFWLDRAVTAAAAAGSLVLIGAAVASIARSTRQPANASSMAASRPS